MTKNKVFKRFSAISRGENKDSSDEYYTLYHAYASLFLELLCRFHAGKTYKIIICPCDSSTSIFHELEKDKDKIGNPKIIYSAWPEKDWADYFDMDYKKEYGCKASEVCIFTNPPFKFLSRNLRQIKCDYLVFGSNCVSISKKCFAKETKGFIYIKNNQNYNGNADVFEKKYGAVNTFFYSNSKFLSAGRQYINETNTKYSILFDKDKLKKISD